VNAEVDNLYIKKIGIKDLMNYVCIVRVDNQKLS
jgi:hypothetical protein